MTSEPFALRDTVERLHEIRRIPNDDRLVTIAAADPLNLTGIVTPGESHSHGPAIDCQSQRAPLVAIEGDLLRPLADLEADVAAEAAAAGWVPVIRGYVGRVG